MEKSSFFNSINHDRRYKAEDWAEYFKSFIGNGVFPNPSTSLQVIASNEMTVQVMAGKAWINGYFYLNTDNLNIKLDNADGQLNRIDRIVVCWDLSERKMSVKVKPSTYSADPTPAQLQRDATKYEIALADVYVGKGATEIRQNNITDLRLNSELCGVVTGVVKQIDTTDIHNRVNVEIEEVKGELSQYKQDEKALFDSWFESIKNILSGDVAGNLTSQIQENKTNIQANTQAITENAESIRQLNANVGQLNEEKIKQLAGENISSISHTFNSVNYDDDNLYNAGINIDANSGILAWANWSHSFYKIEKQSGKIIFYANANFKGKTINYVLFKNSNFIEFIGTVEKQTEIILQTNSENKAELVTKTYTQGSITFKTDRVEARYGGAGGRELIATKPIDLSRFSRIRMYGRFVLESPDVGEVYAGYFGVIKPETVNNLALNPNSSFLASKRISGINSTGYLEIDISKITGEYNVGAFGYSQWDTYRFEILK